MSDKKRRKLGETFQSIEKKLQKTGENLESAFKRIEKRLDDTGESAEKSFERFESKIQDKFERLDKWFEATDEKLDHILETDGLKKYFPLRSVRGSAAGAEIRAVDGVDFAIVRGETLGIVGESGCGKSTVARMMIGLIKPSEGHVRIFGNDMATGDKAEKKEIRRRTGIVFQDPYGSLNPRMTVSDIVSEPLRAFKLFHNKSDRMLKTLEILEACGLSADNMFQFPHQFSGGQRQRICIARALVAKPDIVVCDEAVSALDVSIQAQIINLLCDLRDERSLTYIFISHDLDVVRFIADRIAVMYLGKVVEIAHKDEIFSKPCHPYTVALLDSAPVFGRRPNVAKPSLADEDLTGNEQPLSGCRYRARCRVAVPECAVSDPPLHNVSDGHAVACHLL